MVDKKTKATLLIAIFMISTFAVMCEAKSSLILIQASSGTEVGGFISSDTIWTHENSPYFIVDDVVVKEGVFLKIDPGVVVKFAGETTLVIDGVLIASGNNSHKVIFTSSSSTPKPGDWKGIKFRSSSLSNSLNWSVVEYAGSGWNDFAVYVEGSTVYLINSVIRSNLYAVETRNNGPIFVQNCNITNNLIGIYTSSRTEIYDSTFSDNEQGVMIGGAHIEIYSSIFFNNEKAIREIVSGSYLYMIDCNISNNIDGVCWISNLELYQSIISNNKGTGIICHGRDSFRIKYCTISGNKQNGLTCDEYNPNQKEIHFCNIFDNTPYDIINNLQYGFDINANYNWWGNTNEAFIKEKNYDYYDDYELGKVLYKPYLELEPSAKFELSDIIILPNEIELGNNITINFVISNIGEKSGDYAFILDIEGPEYVYNKFLDGFMVAGFSEVFSHCIAPDKVGDYFIKVDGLTSGFTVTAPIPPKPAEFVVSDLTITPEEVEPGDEVTISVVVSNVGELPESYTVILRSVEDVGDEAEVTLDGGASETVSFTSTMDVEGTYHMEVDGLTGSFTVKEPPTPASFEVYDLQVHPREPSGGEIPEDLSMYPARVEVEGEDDVWTFRVGVNVTNTGELEGNHTVELKINGSIVDLKTLALAGGEDTRILFEVERGIGTYQVDVDGLKDSFEVVLTHKRSSWDKISGFPYESIIFGLIVVVIIMRAHATSKTYKARPSTTWTRLGDLK